MNTTIYTTGYEDHFKQLLDITTKYEISNELGLQIKAYATEVFASHFCISRFEMYGDSYVRSGIGRDEKTGWEALVLCWKKGNKTAIHGHPQFASYTILAGELLVETFELKNGKCEKADEHVAAAADSFFAIGEASRLNNHLHRITCLSDHAHSLHVYSDDARKGIAFTEA